ncbi:dihydrolipoamide acetyltransferase family protein [Agromyces indicus]|uniref:Dihydrolipoamide acetyltransferase component of pyruvate dehydrogenase complex n=1 Tax=Agromyces indicus TaxID=758919 RepID=A0ABU1FIF6_9MICO|nr:dihydrolipoamide acetyltransferase family protein [Agromyces indicus]MDR5691544.1 dihydrolipoamide acetyltransferase family protein [Agromyces indicus]
MATTVRMPEVLANTTEAAIQSWSVAVGDEVAVGQPLAEIETDKAVVEYAAEVSGTVLELLVAEGDLVDVGAPIAVVGEPGEATTSTDAAPAPAATAGDAPADPESAAPVADAEPAFDESTASQEDVASPDGGGETGSAPDAGRRFMSPLVRRLVREHGIDLVGVTGSGPEGRIVRRDVEPLIAAKGAAPAEPAAPKAEATYAQQAAPAQEAAPAASAASTPPAPPAAATTPGADADLIPHTRMRRTIARRLVESKTQVPHFYLTAECRVDRLLELRRELNAAGTVKVSVNDLVVKAVAGALADVPEANRTWSDDGVLQHRAADIAIAVALDDGLVTPVVRGVEGLSVSELGRRIADLAERARSGGLRQHEIEGGSFSVSNLGMYGTREFTAIINPPHAGILAVGAARRAPVVVDGVLEVGTVMSVTLSADHRVLDGAVAARWLAAFQARIEHPLTILA